MAVVPSTATLPPAGTWAGTAAMEATAAPDRLPSASRAKISVDTLTLATAFESLSRVTLRFTEPEAGETCGVSQWRFQHPLAERVSQARQASPIVGQFCGKLDKLFRIAGRQLREPEVVELRPPRPRNRRLPRERHDRHPHPHRIQPARMSIVWERIQCDVDAVVCPKITNAGLAVGKFDASRFDSLAAQRLLEFRGAQVLAHALCQALECRYQRLGHVASTEGTEAAPFVRKPATDGSLQQPFLLGRRNLAGNCLVSVKIYCISCACAMRAAATNAAIISGLFCPGRASKQISCSTGRSAT